jgi:hypothetical protein
MATSESSYKRNITNTLYTFESGFGFFDETKEQLGRKTRTPLSL